MAQCHNLFSLIFKHLPTLFITKTGLLDASQAGCPGPSHPSHPPFAGHCACFIAPKIYLKLCIQEWPQKINVEENDVIYLSKAQSRVIYFRSQVYGHLKWHSIQAIQLAAGEET